MGKNVLYVSGEESSSQIALRAERLEAMNPNLYLLNAIQLEEIIASIITSTLPVPVSRTLRMAVSNDKPRTAAAKSIINAHSA